MLIGQRLVASQVDMVLVLLLMQGGPTCGVLRLAQLLRALHIVMAGVVSAWLLIIRLLLLLLLLKALLRLLLVRLQVKVTG